ncbi:MAG TPA: S8 family serine peptidase [Nitrolancea sp.]
MRHAFRYLVFLVLTVAMFSVPLSALAADNGANATQRYIVTLQPGTNNAAGIVAEALARQVGFHVDQSYNSVVKGFAARLSASQVQVLTGLSQVASIEQDEPTHIADQTVPTGVQRIGDTSNGTAKIDGSGPDLNIDIATLDSGIGPSSDLNIAGGFNATNVSSSGTPTTQQCDGSTASGSYADDNGHGTHVAGTVAAKDDGSGVVGVAPGARLWSVKVFDSSGSGYVSYIICGMDWIAAHASTIKAVNFSGAWSGTSTANCGAGTYSYQLVGWRYQYVYSEDTAHEAVCHLVNDLGIPMIVAAGNDGVNASNTLPAAYPEVISVGAIVDTDGKPGGLGPSTSYGADDTRASFSNYGSAVTLYAPGVNILSDWPIGNKNDGADGTSGLNTISGTSMATPHVTGAVALYLLNHPGATPTQIKQALVSNGEPGKWGSPYGSQPLLNVNNAAFGPTVPTHNMSVNSITPSSPAISSVANNVSVTITNSGNSTESGVSVTLTDGATTVGTQGPLSFTAGQSQTLTFPWTPSGTGNHTLTATVTYNGGATAQNSTTVNVQAVTHALSVASITALSQAISGQSVTVRVHITNAGNQSESGISVGLTDNSAAVGTTQTVPGTLAPGAGTDIDFSWTPSGSGNHAMVATADASDTTPATLSTNINVTTIVHDVAVTSVSVPSSVTQGQSATVSVGVKNNGTATESIVVSLTSSPTNAAGNPASKTISLSAGQSTTVSFNWATATSTGTGSYTLTGHASISPETDATPSDNDRAGTNQISVVAPTSSGGWGGWGGWFPRF